MTKKKSTKTRTAKQATKRETRQPDPPSVEGGEPPPASFDVPPPQGVEGSIASKRAMLDALANSLNEEGHMVMVRGDQAPNPYLVRRPTGIMELDIDLGGGFPAGGTCFISGPDNCGKTWLMMQVMAMQQRVYGEECVLAMAVTEGGFPYDQAMRVGLCIPVPDMMIRQWNEWLAQRGMPTYSADDILRFKQEIGDFRIIRGSTGEEVLQTILEVVRTKACSVICCDSIQGLRPDVDAEKDMDENEKMASHATMLERFFKKYVPLTTGLSGVNETTLLMTQQVRANRAKAEASSNIQKYLKDWAISGSRAAMHYKLIDVVLYDAGVHKQEVPGRGRVAIGKDLKWEFEKGKAGTHDNISGSVKYSYQIPQGVDFVQTVIDSAQQRGLLRKVGKNYTLVRPDDGKVLEQYGAPSLKAFKRCMEVDPSFDLFVRREVLASAGKQCLFR